MSTTTTELEEQLCNACSQGTLTHVARLIEAGVDLNARKHSGDSALQLAVLGNHLPVVSYLVQHGARVDSTEAGSSPLHDACRWGRLEIATLFLDTGKVDLNLQDNQGDTPLHCAVKNRREAIINLLLKKGAATHLVNDHGYTALHVAVMEAVPLAIVRVLLDCMNEDAINIADKQGCTALHRVIIRKAGCENASAELVMDLLGRRANSNLRDHTGKTPLHYAVSLNKLEMTAKLLERGANQLLRDKKGDTPLLFACRNGYSHQWAKLLLRKPSTTIELTDREGWLPLFLACTHNETSLDTIYALQRAHPMCSVLLYRRDEIADTVRQVSLQQKTNMSMVQRELFMATKRIKDQEKELKTFRRLMARANERFDDAAKRIESQDRTIQKLHFCIISILFLHMVHAFLRKEAL
jgi:ankyrin repeat protein